MATKTEAARVANLIRSDLKKAFPGVKFRVTSKNYTGGNSARVEWFDGPTVAAVEPIAEKYKAGDFNGMEDIYEYDRTKTGPTVLYVFCDREMTEATRTAIRAEQAKKYGITDPSAASDWMAVDTEETGTEAFCVAVRRAFWNLAF